MRKLYILSIILVFTGWALYVSAFPPQPPSTGDVTGPASPTTNNIVKFTGTGKGTDNTGVIFDTMTNGKICTYNSTGTLLSCTTDAYQVNLSLLAGTMTNTYLCKYTTAGTLISCDVNPATFLAAGATAAAASNLIFGSDAQYDIPIRGVSDYGRLPTSIGMQSFLGLGITVSGNDVTFPGLVTTTAPDGSRRGAFSANTTISPTAASYEMYVEGTTFKLNQNGTEYSMPLSPTGGQVSFLGPTQLRNYTLPDADSTLLSTANIASSISDSDITHAPDGNSVFDALAGKLPTAGTGLVERIGATFVGTGAGGVIAVNQTVFSVVPYAVTAINNWWVICDQDSGATGIIITPYKDTFVEDDITLTTMCTTGTAPHTTDGAGAGGTSHTAAWDCNIASLAVNDVIQFKVTTAPTAATACTVTLKVTR